MSAVAGIVLAAGQGTRMRSRTPKVLHPLAGRSMIDHVLVTLAAAGVQPAIVVTGHQADLLEAQLGDQPTVRQEPQRGTADAVRVGLGRVPAGARHVVVTMGDVPLLPPVAIQALVAEQAEGDAALALLSARLAEPAGYGRIVRGADGDVQAIVEEADTDEASAALDEVNVGTYCFDAAWLRANIGSVPASGSGEYYLTDLVRLAVGAGRRVAVIRATDAMTVLGINDRAQLARAEGILLQAIIAEHQRNGVTVVDPASTRIDAAVRIGMDARIEPWTILAGATTVAEGAVIGPGSMVRDSQIGPRAQVIASWVESAEVGEDARIGPMAHLRPGSVIGPHSEIGNFAEVKNSRLGRGVRQHHFGYLGDAELGDEVNVGAGTVTANFDGSAKHRTVVGAGAFLGVDTTLRAPVTIGAGARTGAGAVVTHDVEPGQTVVGVPARPIAERAGGDEPPHA